MDRSWRRQKKAVGDCKKKILAGTGLWISAVCKGWGRLLQVLIYSKEWRDFFFFFYHPITHVRNRESEVHFPFGSCLFTAENPPYGSLLCFHALWFLCSRLQPSCLAETGISPLTTNNVRENEVSQCSKLTQAVPDGFYSPVWPMSVCSCECMCVFKKTKTKSSSCW